jgi:hypothetical protein
VAPAPRWSRNQAKPNVRCLFVSCELTIELVHELTSASLAKRGAIGLREFCPYDDAQGSVYQEFADGTHVHTGQCGSNLGLRVRVRRSHDFQLGSSPVFGESDADSKFVHALNMRHMGDTRSPAAERSCDESPRNADRTAVPERGAVLRHDPDEMDTSVRGAGPAVRAAITQIRPRQPARYGGIRWGSGLVRSRTHARIPRHRPGCWWDRSNPLDARNPRPGTSRCRVVPPGYRPADISTRSQRA